jgi:hypothetical protein
MRGALVLLIVCWAVRAAAEGPSPVVYPTQRLPLSFSHVQHLALGGVGCGTCHEDAAASLRAADVLLPREEACTACHEIDRGQPEKVATPAARCDACHVGFRAEAPTAVEPASMPAPNLLFNHKVHADRKIRCTTCHGDLRAEGVGLATRAQLPRMALCLGCHDGKAAPEACSTCHPTGAGGRLETQFAQGALVPSGSLVGEAHDLRFRTEHARVARTEARTCQSCHATAFCQDCHSGRQKPLDFHGGDYVLAHPIDARKKTTECQACHRLQTFCVGCHTRSGVAADERTGQFQRPSQTSSDSTAPVTLFHPSGFRHGVEAQRNLPTCVSCHREQLCMDCHSAASTLARDPHPAGWAGSARCRALEARAGRTCLRCHISGDKRCE